jgi:hypothetical protein
MKLFLKDKKLKAIERLNAIIPDYIGTLTLENKTTEEWNLKNNITDYMLMQN